jgi:hypothetical protein
VNCAVNQIWRKGVLLHFSGLAKGSMQQTNHASDGAAPALDDRFVREWELVRGIFTFDHYIFEITW